MDVKEFPEPACPYGYTVEQVEALMGDRLSEFYEWMVGQTITLCMGQSASGCSVGHGYVVGTSDAIRFYRYGGGAAVYD